MKTQFFDRRASVLIINNNEDDIRQLTDILSSQYEILTANDGQQGISTLRKNISKISVVIMDSQLPVFNKFEYLEQIKNDKILNSIPVIISVDSKDSPYEETWLDLGAKDFIIKPFKKRLVLERISNIIRLRETTSVLQALEYDELTGLLTRQAFIHHAKNYIDQNPQENYTILALDIENFKLTNTQYGEERCNAFLAYLGGQLIGQVETGFAGRFGGDQFVALSKCSEKYNTDYIHAAIQEVVSKAPIPHQIIKVGVYQPIDTALPVVRCCDRAFLAIREIKGVYGKEVAFFEDKLQQQLLNEQLIVECMEKALEEEQFQVFYQPKHESVTGKIAGAEALVRWNHPEYGFMSPGQFIPIFEKNGFITKLDNFVMNKVCHDILKWQENGIPVVPISVNISRRDFFETGWIDRQLKLIEDHKIDHSLLHMEVTESMYSENVDFIISQVKKVQDQGYKIEMDDFGAGYSSLGLLATFPLNVIKLDISFVRNIQVNQIVIENIIKMAHRLGYLTIAEGAETKEEFKILKDLGCDLIQGYVFSKPLPAEKFADYLRKNIGAINDNSNYASLTNNNFDDTLINAINEVSEGIPGGFYSYHADGNHEVIAFNKETLKIYECETAEEFRQFTGNSFYGMVYEEDLPRVQNEIDIQINDNNSLDFIEYRIKCKTGKIKYVRDYGRLVHTEKFGSIYYVFINDSTEEINKRIEEEKKNEVIQGISQTYSSIYLLDYATNKLIPYATTDKIADERSERFKHMENYDTIIKAYTEQFVRDDDKELMLQTALIENIKKELEEDSYFNFTFHLKDIINGINLMEMAFKKLKDENSENRVVITFRPTSHAMVKSRSEKNKSLIDEIEQTKQAEENYKAELQETVKSAKTENQSKQVFIEKATKELLSYLAEIIKENQVAKANIDNKEILALSLDKAYKVQEKLSFTINNILKLSKMENDAVQINERPTDITHAIERTSLVVENPAAEKNIKIETWLDVRHPYIYQDVTLTAEIVCSIVFNAIKYTPKGGTVGFGLHQLPKNDQECFIEFVCRDSGIGMPKEYIPHIFDRFSREDNEINRQIPSSGLGLSIVKSLLDTMNGVIEIKSESGKGTEILVRTVHRYANKEDIPMSSDATISNSIKEQ